MAATAKLRAPISTTAWPLDSWTDESTATSAFFTRPQLPKISSRCSSLTLRDRLRTRRTAGGGGAGRSRLRPRPPPAEREREPLRGPRLFRRSLGSTPVMPRFGERDLRLGERERDSDVEYE